MHTASLFYYICDSMHVLELSLVFFSSLGCNYYYIINGDESLCWVSLRESHESQDFFESTQARGWYPKLQQYVNQLHE